MKASVTFAALVLILVLAGHSRERSSSKLPHTRVAYLGFDRNEYPGDANLAALRRTFSYTGFWLNNPPGSNKNSWMGKRRILSSVGFGFLVSFNGKTYADLAANVDPQKSGESDAAAAVRAARREGFPRGTVIFFDQEQGGRLLPEQKTYLYSWVDGVIAAGFRAGVYCSAVPFVEPDGTSIITAEDIKKNAGRRKIVYWVYNDACDPSPGCSFSKNPPLPSMSGVPFADIWQYAQSPRRPNFASACRQTYNPDGNCYPPGFGAESHVHVDLNTANSNDPSHGRGD